MAFVLPPDMIDRLKFTEGEVFAIAEVPAGLVVTRQTPDAVKQLQFAEEAMDRYAPALAELAK